MRPVVGWPGLGGLGLDREQGSIGGDEGLDGLGLAEQALPLAAVEGDGEAAKAVDGERALFGDFHRDGSRGGGRGELGGEGSVIGLELGDHGEKFGGGRGGGHWCWSLWVAG